VNYLLHLLALVLVLGANAAGLGPYNPSQHAVNGFNPTQLPSLRLWLDANKGHPIGTTNIDLWRDYSRWTDANGTVSHAVQNVDAGYRPKFAHGLNGRPACVFDGVDDRMGPQSYPTFPTNGVGFYMLVAVTATTQTNSQFVIWQGSQSGYNAPWDAPQPGSFGVIISEDDSRNYKTNNVNMLFENATDGGGTGGVSKTFTNARPVHMLYFNNTGGSEKAKSYSKGKLMDTFTLSRCYEEYVWLGGKSQPYNNFDGGILELFVTGQGLTEAQLLQVERYVRTKYGIVEKQP
jgi:hypothetical protein